MENSQLQTSYDTRICEDSHSKRVVVEVLAGLRECIREPVYRVRDGEVEAESFTGVQNLKGCVVLTGCGVEGVSLLGYCLQRGSGSFRSDRSKDFLAMLLALIRASLLVRGRTGRFPRLNPIGCHFDERDGTVVFFPPGLSDFLAGYLADGEQRGVYFIAGADAKGGTYGEGDVVRAMGRLVYFYFAGGRGNRDSLVDGPVHFLSELVPDMPRALADAVWRIMRGKPMGLDALARIVERGMEAGEPRAGSVPLFKRSAFIGFTHSLRVFFAARYKLIIAGVLVGGILAYLFADIVEKRGREDRTRGLGPRSVVELFYTAMDGLDLELLSSLLYKGAGRKMVNELSTLYVMSRYEQILGRNIDAPGTGDQERGEPRAGETGTAGSESGAGETRLFSIEGLTIEEEASGEEPVFRASYLKVVGTAGARVRTEATDTLTLRNVGGRWHIVKIVRDEGGDRGLVE